MVEIFPGEVSRFRAFAVVMATSILDSSERFLTSKSRAKKSLGKAKIMWSVVHTVFIFEWSRHVRKSDSVASYTLSKPGFECNIVWITGCFQPELQSLYGQKSERWKAEPVLFVFEMKVARMPEETVSKLKRSRQMFQVSYNAFYFILSYWCHTNSLNVRGHIGLEIRARAVFMSEISGHAPVLHNFEPVFRTLHPCYIEVALVFSQSESSNFCMYIINFIIQTEREKTN